MLNAHRFRALLRKFIHVSSVLNTHSLIKPLHTLHKHKPRSSTKHFFKHRTKTPPKPKPKIYTREIISNIYKILKYSTWDSAKSQLEALPIKWDSFTVNQVLKTHPPMQKAWLFFDWVSHLKGFKHDQFTYTTILNIFGEAGRVESMFFVFEQMREKGIAIDEVTYTSLMHWVSSSGQFDEAMSLWGKMVDEGCVPTVVSYTAYMKVLFDNGRVKEATDVYKEMVRAGISPNCQTYTVLMVHLVQAGKFKEALDIFQKMQEANVKPDKAACNILVEKCCKAGETSTMTQILVYMKANCLVLRYPVFLEALKTLKLARKSIALLREVNLHISGESSHDEDAGEVPQSIDTGLVFYMLNKQNVVAVDRLLIGLMDSDIKLGSSAVSAIVEVNCSRSRLDGALLAFDYSVERSLSLKRTAYLAILGLSIRSNTFDNVVKVVKEMIKAGHYLGVYLSALLIYRLGCAKRPNIAANVFDLLPDERKDTAAYTALIGVCISARDLNRGVEVYNKMIEKRIRPSVGTYNVVLAGLGKMSEEAVLLRKERNLLIHGRRQETMYEEEKICDLLFSDNLSI